MNLWFVIGDKSYFIDRKASAHAVHEHSRGVLPLLPDVRRLCGKHYLLIQVAARLPSGCNTGNSGGHLVGLRVFSFEHDLEGWPASLLLSPHIEALRPASGFV